MRNVYLSFLGTNNYLRCTYVYRGSRFPDIRFVQEATLRLFRHRNNPTNGGQYAAYFFLTKEAKEKNWLDGYHKDQDTGQPTKGLRGLIGENDLGVALQTVEIPKGESEAELWEIFDRVVGVIQDGDRISFDVTHAFRSIPMFALVILSYVGVIKGVDIERIYYGAFETLGSLAEAKAMPVAERIAPIFDLTSFAYLMQWALGIDRFLKSGVASSIVDLTKKRVDPLLRESKGTNQAARDLKTLAKRLETFASSFTTCRSLQIVPSAEALKESLATLQDRNFIKPFRPLLEKLSEQVEPFEGRDTVSAGIQAVKWCIDHNLTQQAFTILQETVYTHLLAEAGCHPSYTKTQREVASQAVRIAEKKVQEKDWNEPARREHDLTTRILNRLEELQEEGLMARMSKLTARRNDLNHAGTTEGALKEPKRFRDELPGLLGTIEKALEKPPSGRKRPA